MRHPGVIDELRGAPDGARAVDVIERVDEQHV
jgi:hypothetical protein